MQLLSELSIILTILIITFTSNVLIILSKTTVIVAFIVIVMACLLLLQHFCFIDNPTDIIVIITLLLTTLGRQGCQGDYSSSVGWTSGLMTHLASGVSRTVFPETIPALFTRIETGPTWNHRRSLKKKRSEDAAMHFVYHLVACLFCK